MNAQSIQIEGLMVWGFTSLSFDTSKKAEYFFWDGRQRKDGHSQTMNKGEVFDFEVEVSVNTVGKEWAELLTEKVVS